MSDQWRTDEPEVGTVAWVMTYGDRIHLAIYQPKSQFKDAHWEAEKNCIKWEAVTKWQPITTPEERRLQAEVERLREGIRRHREKVKTIGEEYKVPKADAELWRLIETEAGGAGDV